MDSDHSMFYSSKWLIMASGMWKLELEKKLRIPYKIYEAYFWLIFAGFSCLIFMAFITQLGIDNERAIQAVALLINIISLNTKMILSMGSKITNLLRIAIETEAKLTSDDEHINEIVLRARRGVRNLNYFLVIYTYIISFHIGLTGGFVEYHRYQLTHPNATEKPEELFIIWFPFDVQEHYNLALACQLFLAMQVSSANFSSYAIINTMMNYATLRLKILQYNLKNFDKTTKGRSEAIVNLKILIRQHQEIIRFVEALDDSLKYALLLEYSTSAVLFGSVVTQVLNGNRIEVYLPYGLEQYFQMCLLSWNAGEIKTQSEAVADALFESNWHHYCHYSEVRRLMFMIVMRSRKALSLNMGPFGSIDINTAVARTKLAFSYVSVMSGSSE